MKEVIEEDIHLKETKTLVPLQIDPTVSLLPDQRTALCPMLPIRAIDYKPAITNTWSPAPRLGEHTVDILDQLGYDKQQIAELRRNKTVWP